MGNKLCISGSMYDDEIMCGSPPSVEATQSPLVERTSACKHWLVSWHSRWWYPRLLGPIHRRQQGEPVVTLQGSLWLYSDPPHPHRLHRLTKRVAVGSARILHAVLCQPYLFVKTNAKPTRGLLGQTTLARRRPKATSVVHNWLLR
jgi:hypothetical protein